jgi:hypothetical protein
MESERTELDQFLRREGLPPKQLRLTRHRELSNVWSATLAGPMGDAELEIIVYPLGDHAERFTDFEEEKAALWAAASVGQVAESAVVFDGMSERLGVIVLASREEARIARAVREVLLGGAEENTSMWYHPQLDRILGGAWVRLVGGKWTKSSLMPTERAVALHEGTQRIRDATSGRLPDDALPQTLAIFEPERVLVTVNGEDRELTPAQLLALATMALAPPRYAHLAQYVAVIADARTVDDPDVAAVARQDLHGFAAQLLGIAGSVHQNASATFVRGAGCCLRPELVAPSGRLTDLYFLTMAEELDAASLERRQLQDVGNALDVVRVVADGPGEPLADALLAASTAYLRRPLPQALAELVHDTGLVADPANTRLAVLAAELVRLG